MAKILDMPKLSPTMEEGVLQAWHKKEGDAVAVDDLLAEVETDKATMEFRAFDKGTLLKILVPAGTNVKLGQAVAILGAVGDDIQALVASHAGKALSSEASASETSVASTPIVDSPVVAAEAIQETHSPASTVTMRPAARAKASDVASHKAEKGNVLSRTERDAAPELPATTESRDPRAALASPYVRKVARERGIDLTATQGSGEHGRIVPADLDAMVDKAVATKTGGASFVDKGGLAQPEVRVLSPMRKTIARRLTQSKQTVPHFYLTIDIDASALLDLREGINQPVTEGSKKGLAATEPKKVSLNDLIIKAVASALVRVPEANAQFSGEAILVHKRVDISVAVAIPDGLVTPVVRNADQKSIVTIAREVRELASRARAKKLRPEEMSDGTFSISNLGMFGVDAFAAVINPPEGAILAVGQARDEAVVRNGAIVAGKRMTLTLSCDHRVIDGAVGATFLAELRALLEHPMRILAG